MRPIAAKSLLTVAVAAISFAAFASQAATFPGKKSAWHGFDRYEFMHDGRKCYVVTPERAAEGKPWIWRARFFGHEPQADLALLSRGFHLVYCDVGNLFGSPKAVAHWNAFYKYLTEQHALARKPALEGMSRGGLIIYNWAIQNPEKVACLYGDAPVCDFRSWPGKKYATAPDRPAETKPSGAWAACLEAYGLTDEQAMDYRGNPVDSLEPLAKAKVPILHVCGDADTVVPMSENTDIIARRYRALGGSIKVIAKKGVGHHPHSLTDPTPIVEFVVEHAGRGGL